MKTIISYEFNLPEDNDNFKIQTQAAAMYAALWDIAQEVFRPARKHGYSDVAINDALTAADKTSINDKEFNHAVGAGTKLVHLLERKFYDILKSQHSVELN